MIFGYSGTVEKYLMKHFVVVFSMKIYLEIRPDLEIPRESPKNDKTIVESHRINSLHGELYCKFMNEYKNVDRVKK